MTSIQSAYSIRPFTPFQLFFCLVEKKISFLPLIFCRFQTKFKTFNSVNKFFCNVINAHFICNTFISVKTTWAVTQAFLRAQILTRLICGSILVGETLSNILTFLVCISSFKTQLLLNKNGKILGYVGGISK